MDSKHLDRTSVTHLTSYQCLKVTDQRTIEKMFMKPTCLYFCNESYLIQKTA